MTIAFVCGNGVSRKEVNLETCRSFGPIYGCNAMYREFTPDVLVATDKPISTAIQEFGYSQTNKMYTRKIIPGSGAQHIPREYFGFSSGPAAVAIACVQGKRVIYMLGFDLGPSESGKFNNIYADTEFYKKSSTVPTYTGNWIRQIAQVAKSYPDATFIRVKGKTTAEIPEFKGAKNIHHMSMDDFLNRLNNTREL